MCDIVDFIFEVRQSFIDRKEGQDLSKTLSTSSFQNSTNSNIKNVTKVCCSSETIKYAQINEIWSILLLIERQEHVISLVFKLQKNMETFRIHSGFIKTFLITKYSKYNLFPLEQHLNPSTGQIHLSNSFLVRNQQQASTLEEIQFSTNLSSLKKRITSYWQKVIAITEGKFGIQDNFVNSEKALEIKMLALNSQRQFQSENLHNFKSSLSIVPHDSNTLSEITSLLPVQVKKRKESEDFTYKKCLMQVFKNKKAYQLQSIRPTTSFSNFQTLNVQKKDKQLIFTRIRSIEHSQLFKIQDLKFGKLFLNNLSCPNDTLEKLMSSLSILNPNTEHNYLNYYFLVKDSFKQQLLKMALKKLSLKDFLIKNANCLPFQKKLRIFTDIFNVLIQIWERYNTFPGLFSIEDFSITKTNVIKFESIEKWRKLDSEEEKFVTDQARAYYKAEMMRRAQQIFKEMFFSTNLIDEKRSRIPKSSADAVNDEDQQCRKLNGNEIRNQLNFYGVKEILSPIMFCFQKYETENLKMIKMPRYRIDDDFEGQDHQQQAVELDLEEKRNLRKGNLDLVLGTLFKSLELINLMI